VQPGEEREIRARLRQAELRRTAVEQCSLARMGISGEAGGGGLAGAIRAIQAQLSSIVALVRRLAWPACSGVAWVAGGWGPGLGLGAGSSRPPCMAWLAPPAWRRRCLTRHRAASCATTCAVPQEQRASAELHAAGVGEGNEDEEEEEAGEEGAGSSSGTAGQQPDEADDDEGAALMEEALQALGQAQALVSRAGSLVGEYGLLFDYSEQEQERLRERLKVRRFVWFQPVGGGRARRLVRRRWPWHRPPGPGVPTALALLCPAAAAAAPTASLPCPAPALPCSPAAPAGALPRRMRVAAADAKHANIGQGSLLRAFP
jgi:hypothetical protein